MDPYLSDRVDTTAGPDECWPWTIGVSAYGYGQAFYDLGDGKGRRNVVASRAAWVDAHGPIPDGLCVLHRCDTPPCCNPAHLFLGTKGDNAADKVAKGRARAATGAHVWSSKLTVEQVTEIRTRFAAGETNRSALAREFGVHNSQISRLVRGKGWTSVPVNLPPES